MEGTAGKNHKTLTGRLRIAFKGVLDPIGGFLNRVGLTPNIVTALGLLGNTASGLLLALGHIWIGGLVMLMVTPLDALDGTMARLRGETSSFGAFVDSVSDRYAELIILFGLLIHFLQTGNQLAVVLVYLAAAGSVLVSYVKARAEGVGIPCDVGLLTRVERYLVLAPLLVLNLPVVAMWILAILTNFTALQRIWFVRNQARTIRLNPDNLLPKL